MIVIQYLRPMLMALLINLQVCQGLKVNDAKLKAYKLNELEGLHQLFNLENTPPSQTNTTVFLNIGDKQNKIDNCPEGSQLCLIKEVLLPGKPAFISEVFSIPSDQKQSITIKDKDNLSINLGSIQWGDRKIQTEVLFMCANAEDKGFEFIQPTPQHLRLTWKTPLACLSKNAAKKKPKAPKNDPEDTSHWGWFTWLFIFMVLFFAAYIIGNLWINANSTGSNEFLNELIDSLVDVLNRLPGFLKEIWSKVFGDSERGGYSAM